MQGQRELNAIARSGERVGQITLTTDAETTPIINKQNYAGLSGVKVSGSTTTLTFYVSNGNSPFRILNVAMVGDEDAFIAPYAIWAFEKIKIVANVTGVYELRLVG